MPARAAIYLDSNASAPLSRQARDALLSLLTEPVGVHPSQAPSFFPLLPNPSSVHSYGREGRKWLNQAREQLKSSWGQRIQGEVLLTSSGTEANQTAIRACLEPLLAQGGRPHLILTEGEHDATQQMAYWLEARGGQVSRLPLGIDGSPQVGALESLIRPETVLISAIWVNNETGVVTDISRMGEIAHSRGVPIHLDAAQAWGKLPLDLAATRASLVSFSGHKIGVPAGTGALWIAPGAARLFGSAGFRGLLLGKQEGERRGGSENLLGLVALGAAAGALQPAVWANHVEPLRARLEEEVLRRIPGARVHGAGAVRVANTSNFGFDGIEKEGLVMALDLAGFCVSSGSACSSGITAPSHVLKAMGLSDGAARAAVRVSLSSETRWEDLAAFVDTLVTAVGRMRGRAS
jgi:cysteine desulfurase